MAAQPRAAAKKGLEKLGCYFFNEAGGLLDELCGHVRLDWIAGIVGEKPCFVRTAERAAKISGQPPRLDKVQTES